MKFGDIIRILLEQNEMTQKDLAFRLLYNHKAGRPFHNQVRHYLLHTQEPLKYFGFLHHLI